MEFVQYYPTASGKRGNNLLLYEGFLFNGAMLKNAEDENILDKHGLNDPQKITRDLLAQTIFKEIRSGLARENGLLMDLSGVSSDRMDQLKPMLPKGAYDRRECIVSPTTHHSMGGIVIDSTARTAIYGLYAAGEVCGGMHGANRLAGNALAEVFAMGGIAGRNAAIYTRETESINVPENQIEDEKERLESHFSQTGEDSISLTKSLKKMMWLRAGIVRSQDDLEKALTQIEEFKSESRKCRIETPRDLISNIGLRNMMLLSEMVCRSALLRTETRGSHCRSDYPHEDNDNWLKNIIIRKVNNEMLIDMKPVQLEYVSL
jgi:succinate dehydrogenase/fumarate reductase flavoprotein subunit